MSYIPKSEPISGILAIHTLKTQMLQAKPSWIPEGRPARLRHIFELDLWTHRAIRGVVGQVQPKVVSLGQLQVLEDSFQ